MVECLRAYFLLGNNEIKYFLLFSYLQRFHILTLETTRKTVYKNMRLCLAIGKYWLCCRVKRTAPIKVTFTGLEIKQAELISLLYSTVKAAMAWKAINVLSVQKNYFWIELMKTCGNSDKVQNLAIIKLRLSLYILLLCFLSIIWTIIKFSTTLQTQQTHTWQHPPQISAYIQTLYVSLLPFILSQYWKVKSQSLHYSD